MLYFNGITWESVVYITFQSCIKLVLTFTNRYIFVIFLCELSLCQYLIYLHNMTLFFHPSIRTITMGRGPHLRHRPPLPPPCWSDKEMGACLFQGARMKHPGAPRSAPQRMAATALTSPAASVVSLTMTATWSVVTSAGNHPVDTSLFPWSFFF